ncbi:MAG: ATP-binding cassette domain-containing protein [Erysipelotrichaceae bacterium]|jgi:putative ABC transport system ATP-binding protein|nr:ATP-binding cassette domain-containing protein [Erysipelotrichaceae bacterium]
MIELRQVSKTFNRNTPNALTLFSDLNLKIEEGEFVTLIGSNGSGKTTLFNLICGTLYPDSGTIYFDDSEITHMAEHLRNRSFARVFQDPLKGASPSLTILENLSMANRKGKPFDLGRAVRREDISHFRSLLSFLELDLQDKLDTPVSALSGGQRQALSLLMATLVTPKLLLLDEHTAALDPKTSDRIIELTSKIVKDKGITAIMITHNLKQAIECGDRLLMLHKGEIVLDLKGKEKAALSVSSLIERFDRLKITGDLSDEMLLSDN